MQVRSLVPLGSDRRLAAQLVRDALRQPAAARHRVNRQNVVQWARFRRTEAHCNICGHRGTLLFEFPDLDRHRRHHVGILRETLRCRACLSKMRDRTVAAALLDLIASQWGTRASTIAELATRWPTGLRVLDTDANGRIARRLSGLPGYLPSLFQPRFENGAELSPGVVNVDLERIPFEDESFDLLITSEVMEHVRHVDTAHREIARCLSEAGTYVFTVPYDPALEHTWHLIDPETDEFLVRPPHMHGDPGLRAEGIKSYRVFGRSIVEDLRRAGLVAEFAPMERPGQGLFGADLFIATKA